MKNRWVRSLASLSLVSVIGIGAIDNPLVAQTVEPPSNPSPTPSVSLLGQGNQIQLNGKAFAVAWRQTQDSKGIRTQIGDWGAASLLGLRLLSSDRPDRQPVQWFTADEREAIVLNAEFVSPYRYLDVTELMVQTGATLRSNGNVLIVDTPTTQIENVRIGNQVWGKRLVIDLSRPVFWQVSQNSSEGVVILEGNASPSLIARFQPTAVPTASLPKTTDEDDLGSEATIVPQNSGVSLEQNNNLLKVKVDLPAAYGFQLSSLSNPPRLVIDVRPDYKQSTAITWQPGLTWRQQEVSLGRDHFPVTLLEIDPKSPQISLKPITSNPQSQIGTAPLVTTANAARASAAINAGFFNRNNQLPLGAIRQGERWLSGAILNRGAVAWDDRGNWLFDRLDWQETLTANGKKYSIPFLNSGYVQSGLARYTLDWGTRYAPLSDDEKIVTVEGDRVVGQQAGGKAGANSFLIPSEGYLLVIRRNAVPVASFAVGSQLRLASAANPTSFANYPHIVGAGPLLIKNRQIVLNGEMEKFSPPFLQQQASRSAIARTAQGKILLVTAHHRLNGKGSTLLEWAAILQALGAIDALNLDGGSSTALVIGGQVSDRSPITAARVHNGIGVFLR
jgi:hypothetical protein